MEGSLPQETDQKFFYGTSDCLVLPLVKQQVLEAGFETGHSLYVLHWPLVDSVLTVFFFSFPYSPFIDRVASITNIAKFSNSNTMGSMFRALKTIYFYLGYARSSLPAHSITDLHCSMLTF